METSELVNEIAATHGWLEFITRFGINFLVIFILIRILYYPMSKNRDFLFTFFLFNIINFLICFLLSSAKLKMGFAFGLFAIFSILRYRTVTVPVREMGYFFVSVTLGIINSLTGVDDNYLLLGTANAIILLTAWIIDYQVKIVHENSKEIIYDRIDLIHPDKQEEMIEDIRKRTGLNVHRVEMIRIDFFKDVARMFVFYNSARNDTPSKGESASDED